MPTANSQQSEYKSEFLQLLWRTDPSKIGFCVFGGFLAMQTIDE